MNEINKDSTNLSMGGRLLIHFRHIKRIFQNGEKQEARKVTEISLQNLEEWLNEKSKPLMEDVNRKIEEILMKVEEEIQRARLNVEALESAKLMNPNIPFKAKQYMEGNRKAYTRAVNSFIGQMEINNRDYFYLIGFCKTFDNLINDANKSTLRSFTILQEFFSNETGKIAQNLKNFDDFFSELKLALNSEKVVDVNNAREKIQSLREKAKQKINLSIDLRDMEASLQLSSAEKDSVMTEIISFTNSDEHGNFVSLNEEKRGRETAFYRDENEILQSFSALERALRKYSHIAFEHEELVLEYLKQPIETLANDRELKIAEIMQNLERLLNEGQLQIDEKKKEKLLEEIKKLNKEFLQQFLKKYYSFKTEIDELTGKITATGAAEKLKEFNMQLEEINLRIEKSGSELEELKNNAGKLEDSIGLLRNKIEGYIKNLFDEEIKIIA